MKTFFKTTVSLIVLALLLCSYEAQDSAVSEVIYSSSNTYDTIKVSPTKGKKVKNVILIIGDGMGLQHFYTAWVANKGKMNIENCMYTGLSKTYCANKLITDSGASGTAMAIGAKANYKTIGISATGDSIPSLTELAHKRGLSTGIVVTSDITDATPAAFAAKNENRKNYEDIAKDYLKGYTDFVFGGNHTPFITRKDGRNLLEELKNNYTVCNNWAELEKHSKGRLFTVIGDKALPRAEERGPVWGLASMKAIDLLSKNDKGFFVMLEGSLIDHCAHEGNLRQLVEEMFDFDKAIGQILQWASKDQETLVVITADHATGGLTLLGGSKDTGEVRGHFSTTHHSGVMVPIYSYGPQSEAFSGIMENTEIYHKIKNILNL